MTRVLFTLLSLFIVASSFAAVDGKDKKKKPKKPKLEKGIYAKLTTTKGDIYLKLEHEKTPMTVANFVGLAEGDFKVDTIEYTEPFYDGLKFHRVINDFMIQGGDPLGNGTGGPEHRFYDEIHPDLRLDGPGILAMANSGPATNGSQFFITHKETPWLNGKHTVFGHVIAGQDVVNAIQQNDTIIKVKIIRKGRQARKWNATEQFAMVFEKIKADEAELQARYDRLGNTTIDAYRSEMFEEVKKDFPDAEQTTSGLVYIIEDKGTGEPAQSGDQLKVHYKGTLRLDGKQFDSSYDRGQPMQFIFKEQRMIPGFEEGLAMLGKGGKAKLIIPYYAAYGPQGRPGAIPPYSDLIFDIEIVDLQQGSHEGHDHDHDGHNHDGHSH